MSTTDVAENELHETPVGDPGLLTASSVFLLVAELGKSKNKKSEPLKGTSPSS